VVPNTCPIRGGEGAEREWTILSITALRPDKVLPLYRGSPQGRVGDTVTEGEDSQRWKPERRRIGASFRFRIGGVLAIVRNAGRRGNKKKVSSKER